MEEMIGTCFDALSEPAIHLESAAIIRVIMDRSLAATQFMDSTQFNCRTISSKLPSSIKRGDHIVVVCLNRDELYSISEIREDGRGLSIISLEPVDFGVESLSIVLDESQEIGISEKRIRSVIEDIRNS